MRTYTIILVENDEDEQEFMKEAFDASPHFEVVGQARNGNLLFEHLTQHSGAVPDVILSDLNMPGKNGYDILEEMKATEAYAAVPVIITSTSTTRSTIEKCMALGAAGYIPKPDTFIAYTSFVTELYDMIESKKLVD